MENVTALNIGRPAGQGRRHYQHLIDENLEAEENMENEIMFISWINIKTTIKYWLTLQLQNKTVNHLSKMKM